MFAMICTRSDIATIDNLTEQRDALDTQLYNLRDNDDDTDLQAAIRRWHDAEHADAWAVCPAPPCRAAQS